MYVNYEVQGFAVGFQAGPYDVGEVEWHRFDIAGYEGVHTVTVVDRRDETRTLSGSGRP
jgi:hypothetical protein